MGRPRGSSRCLLTSLPCAIGLPSLGRGLHCSRLCSRAECHQRGLQSPPTSALLDILMQAMTLEDTPYSTAARQDAAMLRRTESHRWRYVHACAQMSQRACSCNTAQCHHLGCSRGCWGAKAALFGQQHMVGLWRMRCCGWGRWQPEGRIIP